MKESKLVTILKYGIYAVAFMPLIIFSDFLSPFHFGKVIVFRAWVEILAIFYVALVLSDYKWLPKTNFIFWAVTFFTAVFGLTSLTSVDTYQSFWGTLERMGGWFTFFHFWLFFVIMISVLRKSEDWVTLIKTSVAASLLSTLYGFLQKTNLQWIVGSGGRERIFGTLGNPALFAGYELVNLFFAVFLLLQKQISKNGKLFCGAVLMLDSIALFSTAVRGSVLALVAAAILLAFFYSYSGGSRKIRQFMVYGIGFVVLLETILIFSHNANFVQNSPYLSRLSDISLKTRTVNTRLWAWQAGLEGWKESFKTVIFGWGPENFNIPFSKHFNPKFYLGAGSETLFDRGHNMFVEVLVTMGLIGLAVYLSVFASIFKSLKKIFTKPRSHEEKLAAAVLISGLFAYMVHNAFIFDTSANFIVFFTLIGLAYFLDQNATFQPDQPEKNRNSSVKASKITSPVVAVFTVLVLSMAVVFSIYQTSVKPVLANYATTRAVVDSWNGDQFLSQGDATHAQEAYQAAVDKFQEAMAYDTFGKYDIRHRYGQFVIENLSKFKDANFQRAALISAIENIKKNINSNDLDYLPHLFLSRAYILLGKDDPKSSYNDLALENSLRALQISPTFIRTYFEVAQAYLNKKDYATAGSYFQKAAELNPDVGVSYWYWAVVELEKGNIDKGLQLVDAAQSKGYGLAESDYIRLLNVYVRKNNLKKAAEVYEKLIIISPNNPQYRASLAATYLKIGKVDEAVVEARKAAELNPSFEPEARKFIEGLGRKF